MADQLEILAHGITAILATWLGLLVLTRASRSPGAPIFSLLCLLLVTWSMAIIVQRLGDPDLRQPINLIEDAAAFLLPPVTAHLAISVAFERRYSGLATAVLVVGYSVAVLAILATLALPSFQGPMVRQQIVDSSSVINVGKLAISARLVKNLSR